MKLSIIVCAFNERETIEQCLAQIQAADLGNGWEREVIVLDNCSTDGTREFLRAYTGPNTIIVLNEHNLGKGGSIRQGFALATGEYAVIQDADLEYPPAQLRRLVEAVEQHGADAVLGSRVIGGTARYHYVHAFLGIRLLSGLTNLFFGSSLTDVGTAIKLVRTDITRSLNLVGNGFDLDFELVNKILLAGFTVHEVPVDYFPRTYAQGKKITVRDGLLAVWVILRDRLGLSRTLLSGAVLERRSAK